MATFTINSSLLETPETFSFNVRNSSGLKRFRIVLIDSYLYNSSNVTIDWGDGVIETIPYSTNNSTYSHTYSTSYTGAISVTIPTSITNIRVFDTGAIGSDINFDFDLSYLTQFTGLTTFISGGSQGSITGDLSSLSTLPISIFKIEHANFITGDIANLNNLEIIEVRGSNTITGDISILPNLVTVDVQGLNTLTGDISQFPNTLQVLNLQGNNTIFGTQTTLTNLAQLTLLGNNTISGNIGDYVFSNSMTQFNVFGNNTLTGDINNLSVIASKIFNLFGNNTVFGNLETIGNYSEDFRVDGQNTLQGDIQILNNNINSSLINTSVFLIEGNNTVSGTISNLDNPKGLNITSDSANITGDLNLIQVDGDVVLRINKVTNISYGSTSNWNIGISDTLILFFTVNNSTNALSNSELDQFLIDLNSYTFNKDDSALNLSGGFTRSATSDIAFNQLIADGMNISIN